MKILTLSKSDMNGGAARAAYRLHSGLRKIRVDSKMLVDVKTSDDHSVHGPETNVKKMWSKIRPIIDNIPLNFYNQQNKAFHVAWMGNAISKDIVKEADIINLHWVTDGFLSLKNIQEISKSNKPVVWTLHDMWAFTGGCHYSENCNKYTNFCGACPQLNSHKKGDISKRIWTNKKKIYGNLRLTIVTPSEWLAGCAKKSSLLRNSEIKVISNGLDTDIFKPIEKHAARNILNLPLDKKIILFGSHSPIRRKIKGFEYLTAALLELKKSGNCKDEFYPLVIGASRPKDLENIPSELRFLGKLTDEYSLALSYSAADVFIVPSLQDNFPNTVLESLACGTPVVGFNVGGIPEIITHKTNGYIANYKDSKSLAEGVRWIMDDKNRLDRLGTSAREKALKEYDHKKQALRYFNLYEQLTNGAHVGVIEGYA